MSDFQLCVHLRDAIQSTGQSLIQHCTTEHLCAIVSRETFSKLYGKQCPSFSQRRALLKALKELAARIAGFEERMTNMQPLSAAEEELYNTAQDVPEKVGVAQSMAVRVWARARSACVSVLCACVHVMCACVHVCM